MQAVDPRTDLLDSLQARLSYLRDERLPELEAEWQQTRDDETFMLLGWARDELEKIEAAVANFESGAGRSSDSGAAPGDVVVVRDPDGGLATYLLVDADVGRLDESWLSIESPLGAALVGRNKGDVVEVAAPGGTMRFELVDIGRAG